MKKWPDSQYVIFCVAIGKKSMSAFNIQITGTGSTRTC